MAYSLKTMALKSCYEKTGLQASRARASTEVQTLKAPQPQVTRVHVAVGGEVLQTTNLPNACLSVV